MCRPKPGRRCSTHASSALISATKRLDTAIERHATSTTDGSPAWIVKRNSAAVDKARHKLDTAQLDYDGTEQGSAELSVRVQDATLTRAERAQARQRLERANAYVADLKAQRSYMPDMPEADTPERGTYKELGKARSALALARAMGEDDKSIATHEANVLAADIRHTKMLHRGHPDMVNLTPDEVMTHRRCTPEGKEALTNLSYARAAMKHPGHNSELAAAYEQKKQERVYEALPHMPRPEADRDEQTTSPDDAPERGDDQRATRGAGGENSRKSTTTSSGQVLSSGQRRRASTGSSGSAIARRRRQRLAMMLAKAERRIEKEMMVQPGKYL